MIATAFKHGYECRLCGCVHPNDGMAITCAQNHDVTATFHKETVYLCTECDEVYDDRDDAVLCCESSPKKLKSYWECPICGDKHETEDEALDCSCLKVGKAWDSPVEFMDLFDNTNHPPIEQLSADKYRFISYC